MVFVMIMMIIQLKRVNISRVHLCHDYKDVGSVGGWVDLIKREREKERGLVSCCMQSTSVTPHCRVVVKNNKFIFKI